MREPVESQVAEERPENPLFDKYEIAIMKFQEEMENCVRGYGLRNEVSPIATDARILLEAFILECGLVQTIEALVRTFDQVAAIRVKSIEDNALKRTLTAAAREQGIRISLAGDLAHRLNAGNVEIQVANLHGEYMQMKSDLDTASRLALQYPGMKVPVKLQHKVTEAEERLRGMLEMYPHLQETYSI